MSHGYLGVKSIYNLKSISLTKKRKKNKLLREQKKLLKNNVWSPPSYRPRMGPDFYLTREWKALRWKVLVASDGRCTMCGRGKLDKVVLHVDHIHPRSRFPALELVESNLQVMCADCNLGKGKEIWKPKARKSA